MTPDSGRRSPSGWNLVLSYGDLSHQSGYRTRILGELEYLDPAAGLQPYLLVFDRNPERFAPGLNVQHRALPRRSAIRFYVQAVRLRRRKPIRVVHAHNLYSAALALPARRLFGYKVVLDYHGRIPEEYVFLGKGGPRARRALEALEGWAVRHADHVVVVSHALRDYVADRYGLPGGKLSVIPCCADSNVFRYDPTLREQTRARLGLSNRLVCAHLGSFFEWYESGLLIRVFHNLLAGHPSAHLLVITSEEDNVRTYLNERLAPGTFTVTSAPHDQVPWLLNASDLGLLLLRPSPNIKTSSPAKFAEYLNCGLPVVITPGVGDFSDLVMSESLGEVLEGESISQSLVDSVLHNREEFARRCTRGGQSLTWQAFRDSAKAVFG